MSTPTIERMNAYFAGGGIWNPELANHQAVSDLIGDARDDLARLMAENERLRRDSDRLDWLEQHKWIDEDELFELVNNWVTQDSRRHPAGLRAAIDAASTLKGEPK